MTTRTHVFVLGLGLFAAGAAMVMAARPRQETKPEDVIIVGRVVDLHSYMSGQASTEDPTKDIRDNLRSGVPAVLETDDALVVIGMGKQNPARKLLPLANKEVELTGKLYDKDGLLYVDMQEIKSLEEAEREAEQPGEHPVQPAPDDGQ